MRKAGEVSFADILKDRDGEGLANWLFFILSKPTSLLLPVNFNSLTFFLWHFQCSWVPLSLRHEGCSWTIGRSRIERTWSYSPWGMARFIFFSIYTIYSISSLLTLCTCTHSRLIRTVALTVDHVAALTVDLLLVAAVVAPHLVPALDLLVVPLVVTVTMNVAALLPVIVQLLLNVRARTVMESEALVVTAVLAAAEVLLRKPSLTVADLDPLLLLLVKRKAISGKIHTFVLLTFWTTTGVQASGDKGFLQHLANKKKL